MSSRIPRGVRYALYVATVLAFLSATPLVGARQVAADIVALQDIRITRFDDVIADVLDGDRIERARFAKLAIETMIAAYQTELERADLQARSKPADGSHWRIGTLRYVEHLQRIAASIHPGSSLHIFKRPHSAVRLVIDAEQVMLNAPRLDRQPDLERRIADAVCRFSYCEGRGTTVEERVAERTATLASSWAFASKTPPTYSSSDGLQCIFSDRRHLRLKKDACVNLLHEIRLLTETIVTLTVHGKTIDWRHLRIDPTGPGKLQKVTYSANGSFINMDLPNLLRAKAIWRGAIPWIKASLQGRTAPHVIKLPDRLVYLTLTES